MQEIRKRDLDSFDGDRFLIGVVLADRNSIKSNARLTVKTKFFPSEGLNWRIDVDRIIHCFNSFYVDLAQSDEETEYFLNSGDLKLTDTIMTTALVSGCYWGDDSGGWKIQSINLSNLDKGEIKAFDGTEELELAESIMERETIKITVDLSLGTFMATAYGCDLSYDYVRINSEYST